MYNECQMRVLLYVFALFCTVFACAAPPVPVALPSALYADVEVTTNVVITSWQRGAAKFSFSLSCIATPSNNVEAAFGKDANANGALEPEEMDLIVGWSRGMWFVQNGIDGEGFATASVSSNEVKTLVWSYRLTAATTPARLEAMADGAGVFSELAVETSTWLHDRDWDLMRLTGRGLDASGETFTVGTPLDPTFILFR